MAGTAKAECGTCWTAEENPLSMLGDILPGDRGTAKGYLKFHSCPQKSTRMDFSN